MTEETKVCSKCKIEKHISLFGNNEWYCKECNSIRCKEYKERRIVKVKNGDVSLPLTKVCKVCGVEKSIESFYILNKSMKQIQPSCKECSNKVRREKRIDNKEYEMLKDARRRAKKNGLNIDIDENDIVIPDVCPVLGIPIVKDNDKSLQNSPSLDRIDNTKGYVKGNVQVISWRANCLKRDATSDEHRKIAEYMERMTHLTESQKR